MVAAVRIDAAGEGEEKREMQTYRMQNRAQNETSNVRKATDNTTNALKSDLPPVWLVY